MMAILLPVGFIALVVVTELVVYTYLIFPNFDGMVRNIHWYTYDINSQHYLYWSIFWIITLLTLIIGKGLVNTKLNTYSQEGRVIE